MCFSSRNSHGGKHIFSISSLEAVFPPPAGNCPRHPLRARLGQKISNRKLSVISLYYGRWQYYALGGAGDPGGILRLFSASETAFSSLNQIRLKSRAEDGDTSAARVLAMSEKYDKLLSTILIGNNIVNIAAASIGTVLFTRLLDPERGRDGVHLRAVQCGSVFGRGDPQEPCKGDAGDGCHGGFALFEPAHDPVHPADLAVSSGSACWGISSAAPRRTPSLRVS